MKMTLICMKMKTARRTHFHMRGFALRLVLNQRHKRNGLLILRKKICSSSQELERRDNSDLVTSSSPLSCRCTKKLLKLFNAKNVSVRKIFRIKKFRSDHAIVA